MANLTCPYCGRAAAFEHHAQRHRIHGRLGNDPEVSWVSLSACPACGGVVAIGHASHDRDTPVGLIPTATVAQPDALIPAAIRDDLFEARKCYSVGATKATAVMCRRALQGACVEQGASPKKNLHDQIDEVVGANKVHGSLKEWADAIRLVGNSGAHVGDDGLEDVSAEEADDILAFTEEFMNLMYVARERVRLRLEARAKAP